MASGAVTNGFFNKKEIAWETASEAASETAGHKMDEHDW